MIVGGGDLARALFEAGVIEEIGFNIHPVLLGSAYRFFTKCRDRSISICWNARR